MADWFDWVVGATLCCYALAMVTALIRLAFGPAAEDRILAMELLTGLSMMWVLVDGIASASAIAYESTLLVAVTGYVTTLALAKFLLRGEVIE